MRERIGCSMAPYFAYHFIVTGIVDYFLCKKFAGSMSSFQNEFVEARHDVEHAVPVVMANVLGEAALRLTP